MTEEPHGSPVYQRFPSLVGPYEIIRVLGRGGMGVVYHVQEPFTRASAAVKTLERVRDHHVASIRREIQTLATLSHEGVVRITNHGVTAGVPWYAMELLTGQTLRDLLRETQCVETAARGEARTRSTQTQTQTRASATQRHHARAACGAECLQSERVARPCSNFREALLVLHGVCEVLSYLHERGVVHRDLKPENIFIRADGSPVLVDFGISARFGGSIGREQLDAPAAFVGTVAYMAPEQIRGELVDARADLYALGCILYECLTGEPPFAGVSSSAILRAHLRQKPIAPSLLVDGIPKELDRLTLQLLEKEPAQRLGFADDVARALRAVLPDAALRSSPQALPYLYRPAFVGRRASFRELQEAVRELARHRRGGRISLGGESGVGKTRLAMEAVREAALFGVPAVLSRCQRLGIDDVSSSNEAPLSAFAPLLTAVTDHCCQLGAAETARLLGAHAKVLVSYFPILLELPGFDELPSAPPLSPCEARARVLASVAATLFAFAEHKPLLLVIDDVQWADELSLSLLAELSAERLASNAILVLGTYRMDDASPAVSDVMRAPRARHLELGRFGLGEVSALVRGMLALDQSPLNLVANLQRKCSGNPFFVVEYLRSAIADGLLTREDGRWRFERLGDLFQLNEESLVVPDGVARLIELRLRDLDAVAQNLVHAAAILGREFDVELLLSCAALSEDEGFELLQLLRQRQILEDADDGRLRFVHDAIRENAYRGVSAPKSVELHLRAAEALEPRCATDPFALRSVAHHFARAGVSARARTYYRRAGEFAAERYANADAIVCFEAALREADHPESDCVLLEKLGDLLSIAGKHPEARGAYERALLLSESRELVGKARLHRKIGKTWETHHNHARAGESYDRATALLRSSGERPDRRWWSELVQVHLERLWVCYWLNHVEEMDVLAASMRTTIERRGDTFQKARFLQLLVMLETRRERCLVSAATVALAREACAVGEKLSQAERASLDFVLFFTLVLHGSLDEAEQQGRAVLTWAKRVGAATLQTRCLTYLMVIARRRGRLDEVRTLSEDCAASCASSRLGEYDGALKANLAWLAIRQAQTDQARKLAEEALQAWSSIKVAYPLQWLARFPLLALSVAEGDLDSAVEHARRLLDSEQQRLPADIARALERALQADEASREDSARAQLERLGSALEYAREHLYL